MVPSTRVMNGWQLFCFGLLSAPLALAGFAVVSFVPTFYAVDMGVGLAATGAIFMFGRFLDVFTDPLIGHLSDQTKSRFGPRLPWMLAAFPFLLLFGWLLLSPPAGVGPFYLFCVASGYLLCLTLFDVPYSSIGLEISPDTHERTYLASTKAVFQIIGAILASLIPVALATPMGVSLGVTAQIFVALSILSFAIFLMWTPRLTRPVELPKNKLLQGWKHCLSQTRFRMLLTTFFTVQAANAMTVGLMVLFMSHVIQAPDQVGQMFLLLFICTALFLPLWIVLSKRIGKVKTWIVAITLCSVGLSGAYLMGPGTLLGMQAICVILGACFTCDAVMPTSILADIVYEGEAAQDQRRAATYLALKNAASKMAFVAPMGLAFPVLSWAGFDKTGVNDPQAVQLLLFFFAGLPIALRLGVAAFLWNKRHSWDSTTA